MSDNNNRRDVFRINDSMYLVAKALTDDELQNIEHDFNSYRIEHCLMTHLYLQRESRKASLLMVRKHSPEVATYLEMLEDDMVLIASRLAADSEFHTTEMQTSVNLSSIGISFETKDSFELNQKVELFMTLSTSGANILLVAEVVRINELESGTSVGLRYTSIHPNDEDAIIRHMAKLQQMQLQARQDSLE